jgi:hypothetical protein
MEADRARLALIDETDPATIAQVIEQMPSGRRSARLLERAS